MSIGQMPEQIPTKVKVWWNVKCQNKWGGGCIWFINLNSLIRGGNSSNIYKYVFTKQEFLILLKTIWPQILHCAIECVTLCWSASEGLSPQLGKEASLLPSNTIHTLLTLPPTVLSPPVHSHPDTSFSSYRIAPWVNMSGVTINACLLLALTNTSDGVAPLFASLGSRGSETTWRITIRKWPHLQRKSELRLAGRQCTNTLNCSLERCILFGIPCCTDMMHTHIVREY